MVEKTIMLGLVVAVATIFLTATGLNTGVEKEVEAQAQMDSNMMDIITENAEMLRGMATWINGCTDSVYSGDTQRLDKCFQFAKEFNTQMKQITQKYGIEKESQMDISSFLKKYNLN